MWPSGGRVGEGGVAQLQEGVIDRHLDRILNEIIVRRTNTRSGEAQSHVPVFGHLGPPAGVCLRFCFVCRMS